MCQLTTHVRCWLDTFIDWNRFKMYQEGSNWNSCFELLQMEFWSFSGNKRLMLLHKTKHIVFNSSPLCQTTSQLPSCWRVKRNLMSACQHWRLINKQRKQKASGASAERTWVDNMKRTNDIDSLWCGQGNVWDKACYPRTHSKQLAWWGSRRRSFNTGWGILIMT